MHCAITLDGLGAFAPFVALDESVRGAHVPIPLLLPWKGVLASQLDFCSILAAG